jgi:hypothetical protein
MVRGVIAGLLLAAAAMADGLPGDVQRYVDRREACNYWPTEHPARHSLREAEVERHTRNLYCDTLDHELAVLEARYRKTPVLLQAMRDAHDAMPEY